MQLMVIAHAKSVGLTVLLDGQGADECWMGYQRYVLPAIEEDRKGGPGMAESLRAG